MIQGLCNHLVQSTVCVGVVCLLSLALRNNAARVRFWLWFAASMKFLLPFSLLVDGGAQLASAAAWSTLAVAAPTLGMSAGTMVLAADRVAAPFGSDTLWSLPPVSAHPTVAGMLLIIWMSGVASLLIVWLARWRRVSALVRSAEPLELAAPIPVLVGRSRLEPGLIGVRHPVLLLPEGLFEQLSPQEMDAILAHELCHLRRSDNLLAGLHMFVATLFWFHPLIWWVGKRLLAEREQACDEAVLASGKDGVVYAEGLLKVCRHCLPSPLACASGVSGSDLARRTRAILDDITNVPLSRRVRLMLAAALGIIVVAPVAFGMLPAPGKSAQGEDAGIPTPALIAQRRYDEAKPRTTVTPDPARFDRFIGYYRLPETAVMRILRKGAQYELQQTGQAPLDVYPDGSSEFYSQGLAVPLQIDFLENPAGDVIGLTVHQYGLENFAPRVDESVANSIEAAIRKHIVSKRPVPGTEEFVRHIIDVLERSAPMDYHQMSPDLAGAMQSQLPYFRHVFLMEGAFQSLQFSAVAPDGSDVYEATFVHGRLMIRCPPPMGGKEYALGLGYAP